jgi:hypothetical protein
MQSSLQNRANCHSCVPKIEGNIIKPGKYYIQVDPIWNSFVQKSDEFKKVVIDLYCQQKVRMTEVSTEFGLIMLA